MRYSYQVFILRGIYLGHSRIERKACGLNLVLLVVVPYSGKRVNVNKYASFDESVNNISRASGRRAAKRRDRARKSDDRSRH